MQLRNRILTFHLDVQLLNAGKYLLRDEGGEWSLAGKLDVECEDIVATMEDMFLPKVGHLDLKAILNVDIDKFVQVNPHTTHAPPLHATRTTSTHATPTHTHTRTQHAHARTTMHSTLPQT